MASTAIAQDFLISFEDFESAIRAAKIPDYSKSLEFEKNSDGYTASLFNSLEDYLLIKLEPKVAFSGYLTNATQSLLEGHKSAYYVQEELTFLALELQNLNAILVLASAKSTTKAAYEAIAKATGLLNKESKKSNWPDEIKPIYRIDADILSFEKRKSDQPDYRFEVYITALMSARLKASVEKLCTTYENNVDFVNMPGLSFLYLNGDMKTFKTCCKDGDEVKFLYYVK